MVPFVISQSERSYYYNFGNVGYCGGWDTDHVNRIECQIPHDVDLGWLYGQVNFTI